ncbi:hypothetical protein KSP40_PGU015368 [Platanthera guangdongensis]|uniref:NUP210 Ig-like domain-containing protein n=1 Tax=Platanthera guangdongensis TaxID=2320717 RepID=A0ABR2LZ09_9ASPA
MECLPTWREVVHQRPVAAVTARGESMAWQMREARFVTFIAFFELLLDFLVVIELPSPHHYWSVLNPSVARVDSMMGTVHALHLGMTNVVVNDTRLSGHIQTSALHVVLPKNILLYLVPVTATFDPVKGVDPIPSSETWFVFPGQLYIIGIQVFSEGPDSREILILEKANIKLEDDTSEFWDILLVPNAVSAKHSWQNSRLLKPYFVGEGVLTASLFYHSENKEEVQALRAVQGVTVCKEVKFSGREQVEFSGIIYIPWAPGIYQEVELKATGGCGNLFWSSTNEEIASVTASGFVMARMPGTTTIKVISLCDSINYDEVVLEVTQPSSITFLPVYPVEVAVGTELKAAVTLKTTDGNYFYQCDAFNSIIRWNIFSESEIFSPLNITEKICEPNIPLTVNIKQSFGQPCAWTCLFAYGHGRAMLHATLSMELYSPLQSKEEPLILRADYLIVAYSPLVAYQAGNGNKFGGYWVDIPKMNNGLKHSHLFPLDELYLAPGSAIDVLLSGGPERWDHHVEYVESADITSEEILSVTDGAQVSKTFSTGTRLYTKILFSRGNLVGRDHPVPTIANLELSVVCSIPSSITLVANEPANTLDVIEAAANADRSSGHVRSSPIIVANGRTIRIAAVGLHISKKAFANSSSLCLSWEFFGCKDLSYWSGNENCKRSTDNNWERFLVLNKTSGSCTVSASIIGFSEIVVSYLLGYEFLHFESAKGALTDTLQLQFVSSLRILPESVVVVFDPRAEDAHSFLFTFFSFGIHIDAGTISRCYCILQINNLCSDFRVEHHETDHQL